MVRKVLKRIATSTKPQGKPSPTTSEGSSSEKSVQEETLEEAGNRVTQMMIENLKNPANHPTYREYPHTKDK
jgi:hypothetical protein